MANHYGVLGLGADATELDVRRAYRARAKLAHPDAGGDAEQFRALLLAYETLVDPDRRRVYDAELGIANAPLGWASGGSSWATPSSQPGSWTGAQGDFDGNVTFPGWLHDVTDGQWRPGGSDPAGASTETRPAHDLAPADVRWWWPDRAVAPPQPAGALLVVPGERAVIGLDLLTGHEVWRTDLPAGVRGRVLVADDTVVTWTADGTLHGLELARGVPRWSLELGPPGAAGLSRAGSLILASPDDPRLVAIDAHDPSAARPVWSARLAAPATRPLAFIEGAAVVISGARVVEAIDLRRGKTRWQTRLPQPVELPPVVMGGYIWLAGGGPAGIVVRLDPANGAVHDTIEVGNAFGGLAADADLVYVCSAGPAQLVAYDRDGRRQLAVATRRVCPEPAIGVGTAYLAEPDGRLLAVDIRTGPVGTGGILATTTLPFEPVGSPELLNDQLIVLARDGRIWATALPERNSTAHS